LTGLAFALAGAVAIGWSVHDSIHPESAALADGIAVAFLIGGVACGMGVLILRVPASRPDLGDPLVSDGGMRLFRGLPANWSRPVVPGREHRTWWTGDTKPPST
jgi:hypothetical protein